MHACKQLVVVSGLGHAPHCTAVIWTHLFRSCQQHIVGREVAMHDALRIEVVARRRHLRAPARNKNQFKFLPNRGR